MSAFPTLESAFQSFPEQPVDDTISSESEAGYTTTRPRFTRVRRTFGPVKMILTRADRDALVAFDATVRGSSIFTLAHPDTGEVLNVRFASKGRVKVEAILSTHPDSRLYAAEFSLEEV